MIKLIWRLLTDETAALGLFRGAAIGLGTAFASGQIDLAGMGLDPATTQWLGVALAAMGGFARSTTASAGKAKP